MNTNIKIVPSLEETLLEVIRISFQLEHEEDRVSRERAQEPGRSALDNFLVPFSEYKPDLVNGDPRFELLAALSFEDVRRIEILAFAGRNNQTLTDAPALVSKNPREGKIDHLLSIGPLRHDLIVGWGQAIRHGVSDLREWDPDAEAEAVQSDDDDDDDE